MLVEEKFGDRLEDVTKIILKKMKLQMAAPDEEAKLSNEKKEKINKVNEQIRKMNKEKISRLKKNKKFIEVRRVQEA